MNKRKSFSVILTIVLSFVATVCFAQDFLAKQAPIDRHIRKLDTLALRSVLEREEQTMPASALYNSWDNTFAHRATELPDSFRINLRHFAMPCDSRVITSNFGPRWGRNHRGIDLKVYIGDTIRAAFSGKVRMVKYEAAGYGKYVVIRHNNGLETIYGHMSAWLVDENQTVKAGQPIGLGGNTGRSTGSHLHFETRLCGLAIDPRVFFDFINRDVVADTYMFRRSKFDHENKRVASTQTAYSSTSAGKVDAVENVQLGQQHSSQTHFHKVAVGETLYSIAKKRGVTVDELCKMNHLGKDVKVRPGQLLRYN